MAGAAATAEGGSRNMCGVANRWWARRWWQISSGHEEAMADQWWTGRREKKKKKKMTLRIQMFICKKERDVLPYW